MDSKLRLSQMFLSRKTPVISHRVAEEISTSSQTVLRSAKIPKSAIRRDLDMNSIVSHQMIWAASRSFNSSGWLVTQSGLYLFLRRNFNEWDVSLKKDSNNFTHFLWSFRSDLKHISKCAQIKKSLNTTSIVSHQTIWAALHTHFPALFLCLRKSFKEKHLRQSWYSNETPTKNCIKSPEIWKSNVWAIKYPL